MKARINGINLHYQVHGQGEPVLFIHGFPLSGELWTPAVERLGTGCSLVIPDLRGLGQSESTICRNPGLRLPMKSFRCPKAPRISSTANRNSQDLGVLASANGDIAAALGHADTRITEKHYAHLMPNYVADTIRANLPTFSDNKSKVRRIKRS